MLIHYANTQIGTSNIAGMISWSSNDSRHWFGFS